MSICNKKSMLTKTTHVSETSNVYNIISLPLHFPAPLHHPMDVPEILPHTGDKSRPISLLATTFRHECSPFMSFQELVLHCERHLIRHLHGKLQPSDRRLTKTLPVWTRTFPTKDHDTRTHDNCGRYGKPIGGRGERYHPSPEMVIPSTLPRNASGHRLNHRQTYCRQRAQPSG